MQFGLQLFGIYDICKKNPETLFKKLSDIGYQYVEPCIAFGNLGGFEQSIWTVEEFERMLPLLKKHYLEVISCHVFSLNLQEAVPEMKRLSVQYGIQQFVLNCPDELTKVRMQEVAFSYIQAAEEISKVGARILIHNGSSEIAKKIDGRSAYEWFMDACLGRVDAQVDVGWLLFAGEDPEQFLWRNKDRVKSIHYKDFKTPGNPDSEVYLGQGALDAVACFQFARAMGITQIIDQDQSQGDVYEDLRNAYQLLDGLGQCRDNTVSYLNIMDTKTGEVKVLRRYERIIEAPNWLKKENVILYNSEGYIYRYDIQSDTEIRIESGECNNCNNDHVISADEKWLAVSHGPKDGGFASRIYILPLMGGIPRLVTPNTPSFLHGWSPDGEELAYCAFREHDGHQEVDIYTIPAEGGEEKRLTLGGFNDGPEYSPDGKHIWFNSTRTGLMQVWRMNRDGSEPVQMTMNESNNWFPHISPDGRKVVYLSYRKGDLKPTEHFPNMQVELWMMNYDGSGKQRMLSFFGGQGSINVNSWAADSRHIAFISYELIHGIK